MNRVNRTILRSTFVVILICLSSLWAIAFAQPLIQSELLAISSDDKEQLDQVFGEYTAFNFDPSSLYNIVSKEADQYIFTLSVGREYEWTIALEKNDMRPAYYVHERSGPNGMIQVPRSECITYAGYVVGDVDQIVRLNIQTDKVWGYIFTNNGMYFIEPLCDFIDDNSIQKYLLYNGGMLTNINAGTCGADCTMESDTNMYNKIADPIEAGNDCRKLEIATDSDWEFYDDGETTADIRGNLNMVEGVYQSQFDMEFLIVYQHEWTTSNDPYTNDNSGCSNWGAMDEFGQVWYNDFDHIRRDINLLYSEKDLIGSNGSSAVGCAWTGQFGNDKDNDGYYSNDALIGAYLVMEWMDDIWYTSAHRMVDAAHEMGHSFGSGHTSTGIMQGTIDSGATSFSASSVTQMVAGMDYDPGTSHENDGRTALRQRFLPSNTNYPITFLLGGSTSVNNALIADDQCSIINSGTITLQATDNVFLKPGFNATAQPGKNFKMKITDCDN